MCLVFLYNLIDVALLHEVQEPLHIALQLLIGCNRLLMLLVRQKGGKRLSRPGSLHGSTEGALRLSKVLSVELSTLGWACGLLLGRPVEWRRCGNYSFFGWLGALSHLMSRRLGLLHSCLDIITLIRMTSLNSLRVSMNLGIFFDIFMRIYFNLNRSWRLLLHIADRICRDLYLSRRCVT
jgi:hypothetical protein